MTEAHGLALWLMPDGETEKRLAAWIDRLALRFGTERFRPHLTLVSGLGRAEGEVLAATERAARSLPPFTVHLDGVDGRDEHFRCLFVHATADAALRGVAATFARALGREQQPDFLPHLSLVYGTLPAQAKHDVAREAGADVAVRFEARSVHVWRCSGPVAGWREADRFELGG